METSINDAYEANKEIEKLIQTVNTAVNQLIDSKNILLNSHQFI